MKIRKTYDALAQANMKSPSDSEVAAELGISEHQFGEWLVDVGWTTVWSVDELEASGNLDAVDESLEVNPSVAFDVEERKSTLARAIRRLSLKEQQVLYAYYQEELTLKEIAYVMDLSESQISRIHSKAVLRLRGMMSGHKAEVL